MLSKQEICRILSDQQKSVWDQLEEGRRVVEFNAGAGSGKTWLACLRSLYLINSGEKRILWLSPVPTQTAILGMADVFFSLDIAPPSFNKSSLTFSDHIDANARDIEGFHLIIADEIWNPRWHKNKEKEQAMAERLLKSNGQILELNTPD